MEKFLTEKFEHLVIEKKMKESGQRAVYFAHFNESDLEGRSSWMDIVIKASEMQGERQSARLLKEIEVLKNLESKHYPELLYHEIITRDPVSGKALSPNIFVTIERRIPGVPLSEKVDEYRRESEILNLLSRLSEALNPLWTHNNKLVHRDLKPDNIMVRPDGSVAIIDLGLLREEGQPGLTNTNQRIGPGTLLYFSPEQAKNKKYEISFRSDLFSLGVIAYELMAKEPYKRFRKITLFNDALAVVRRETK